MTFGSIWDRDEADGGVKIDELVDFPLEGLDLNKYVSGVQKNENLIYDCYAVSNHYGQMGFGHYTAFARSFHNNKWHEFDDSNVSEISDENAKDKIVGSAAYSLFYRRRDWH